MIYDYKASNVDTDKALEHIEWSRKYQEEMERLEVAKIQEYHKGIRKGLDIAEEIFTCSNFEKKMEPTFSEGVIETIYELGKELDIPTQDMRDNFVSIDEICTEFAKKVKDIVMQYALDLHKKDNIDSKNLLRRAVEEIENLYGKETSLSEQIRNFLN